MKNGVTNKRELLVAIISVVFSFSVLVASTYAWFVTNTSVDASSSTVSAMANGMTLQIVSGTEPNHGKDSETIAFDSTKGHEISPASTNDFNTWYVPQSWSQGAIVSKYDKIAFSDIEKGEYLISKQNLYAYVLSTYTLYTVRDTGIADVYLDGTIDSGAIQVTLADGTPVNDKIAKCLRIGIYTINRTTKEESLRVVYAPSKPIGVGNDEYSIKNNLSGWITVKNSTETMYPTYSHIFESTYKDQNNKNWAATKSGNNYIAPTENPAAIASGVDYNGVIMKIYIWLEGTDSDCVNTSQQQIDEKNMYNVTIHLVGVEV